MEPTWLTQQRKISRAINESMALNNFTWPVNSFDNSLANGTNPNVSYLHELCHSLHGSDNIKRTGCCQPTDVRHLYNVMISKGKMVFFDGTGSKTGSKAAIPLLPKIKSLKTQHTYEFNMPIERTSEFFPPKQCKKIFEGTLHVIGRSTAKNVYHAGKVEREREKRIWCEISIR